LLLTYTYKPVLELCNDMVRRLVFIDLVEINRQTGIAYRYADNAALFIYKYLLYG